MRAASLVLLGFVTLLVPAVRSADAQGATAPGPGSDLRREASAIVGASLGDGEPAPAISATLGFRVTRLVGVAFELAYARKLDFTLDLCPQPRVCIIGGEVPVTGRTVTLVPHVVVGLPAGGSRVRPYAVAGVGVTQIRQWYLAPPRMTDASGGTSYVPGAPAVEFKRSNVALALSVGGGVAVDVSRRFAIGGDVRVVRLFDEQADLDRFIVPAGTMTMVRVGSRISYRF